MDSPKYDIRTNPSLEKKITGDNPSYEVIADYPFNKHFKVGDILELHVLQNGEIWYHYSLGDIHQNFEDSFFKQYPAIFKPVLSSKK